MSGNLIVAQDNQNAIRIGSPQTMDEMEARASNNAIAYNLLEDVIPMSQSNVEQVPETPRNQMPGYVNNMRGRAWCATINNYTMNDYARATSYAKATYGIVGKETGKNGTPHLQIYWRFDNALRFSTLKTAFPTAHLELAKGDAAANIKYCSKEGSFIEFGERPDLQARLKGILHNLDTMSYMLHQTFENSFDYHINQSDLKSYTNETYNTLRDIVRELEERFSEPLENYVTVDETIHSPPRLIRTRTIRDIYN